MIIVIILILMCLRYLVESASGVYTGSVFHDKRIEKEGHHGEFRCFMTIVLNVMKVCKCIYHRKPGDGSTLLQKSHHNSLVLILCVCDIEYCQCYSHSQVGCLGHYYYFFHRSSLCYDAYHVVCKTCKWDFSPTSTRLCSQVRQPKVTQKLSWRKKHIKFFGGRGVVIVRNPFRALISYWNHQVLNWFTQNDCCTPYLPI